MYLLSIAKLAFISIFFMLASSMGLPGYAIIIENLFENTFTSWFELWETLRKWVGSVAGNEAFDDSYVYLLLYQGLGVHLWPYRWPFKSLSALHILRLRTERALDWYVAEHVREGPRKTHTVRVKKVVVELKSGPSPLSVELQDVDILEFNWAEYRGKLVYVGQLLAHPRLHDRDSGQQMFLDIVKASLEEERYYPISHSNAVHWNWDIEHVKRIEARVPWRSKYVRRLDLTIAQQENRIDWIGLIQRRRREHWVLKTREPQSTIYRTTSQRNHEWTPKRDSIMSRDRNQPHKFSPVQKFPQLPKGNKELNISPLNPAFSRQDRETLQKKMDELANTQLQIAEVRHKTLKFQLDVIKEQSERAKEMNVVLPYPAFTSLVTGSSQQMSVAANQISASQQRQPHSRMNIEAKPFKPQNQLNIGAKPFEPQSRLNIGAKSFELESSSNVEANTLKQSQDSPKGS